jgi:hypothetical protein
VQGLDLLDGGIDIPRVGSRHALDGYRMLGADLYRSDSDATGWITLDRHKGFVVRIWTVAFLFYRAAANPNSSSPATATANRAEMV